MMRRDRLRSQESFDSSFSSSSVLYTIVSQIVAVTVDKAMVKHRLRSVAEYSVK